MAKEDYYHTLGVSRRATEKEIQSAYRRLARKYHPDVKPGDEAAHARLLSINEAYEVLKDARKRAQYDLKLENEQSSSGLHGWQNEARRAAGGFTSRFDHMVRHAGRVASRRGEDHEKPVEITLSQAYYGTKRIIEIDKDELCPDCRGRGKVDHQVCPKCKSRGVVSRHRRLEVTIKPGIQDGARIRVPEEGGPGWMGGQRGDLYLAVEIAPDPDVERRGKDLYTELPINLYEAVLGGEVEVSYLGRTLMLKIPPATQNGRVFRLAARGMPSLDPTSIAPGDLYVTIRVVLPTDLTPEERILFQRLQEAANISSKKL